MASTNGLVPITRAFLSSYYDKYPFPPIASDVSRLSDELHNISNELCKDSPSLPEGERLLLQEAESEPPHKMDENMWKNREHIEEIIFLLESSHWPKSLQQQSTPEDVELAEVLKQLKDKFEVILKLVESFQSKNSNNVFNIVMTYMPQDFRGTLIRQQRERSERNKQAEVDALVNSGGSIRDRYALLWKQQMERRRQLSQLGSATGVYKTLVKYLVGVPQVLHDTCKMHKFKNFTPFLILIFSSINVLVLAGKAEDPFTPRAYIIRYWKKQISNDLPKPSFLIEKASPLTAVQSAAFSKLAENQNALSTNLPSFCSAANLLCFPDVGPSLEKHSGDVNFKEYSEQNFTNYGSGRLGGLDSFKNYSNDGNSALDSFRRYSRDSVGHGDRFSTYARNTNVPDQSFNTYGTKATGGSGDFAGYAQDVNVPNMRFTSYSDDVNGRVQTFASYSQNANAGDQSFTSYGKNGNGATNQFKSYGNNSNVIGSSFSGYGEKGNGANDSFTSYGENGNVPQNNFKSYADGGNAAVDTFANYRDQSNVGDDSFKSYAKSSNAADMKFTNYGNSFNEGTDTFSGYGGGTVTNQKFGFKMYGVNNTFKDYADKKRASFATYATKASAAQLAAMKTKSPASGKPVNKWIEPGKFFRESMLKSGTIMPMPDIRDKMPKRSFLPRVILSKLPFSSSKIADLKKIFHAEDNSSMASLIANSLNECERKPSQGESKQCVGSVEDMIDFATSLLGRDVVVRTTDNTNGSGKKVKIGPIKKINGGKITKSVSCHQSLFPYLLYYCHSVPKVRVYEADLLDPTTTSKINHGVAICHIDTSAWSPTHGAFLSLGSEPGKIEVCHWIFENDMTWAVAD